jgi:hypothetical protein
MNNIVAFVLAFIVAYCLACYAVIWAKGGTPEYPTAFWVVHIIFGIIFYFGGGWIVYQETRK